MLINFSFKNFKSFADTTTFTMAANSDRTYDYNLIKIGRSGVSKTRIIYGANGSGKSAFIEAIKFVQNFISESNNLLENDFINVIPYKFRTNPYTEPSEFSLTFIKGNVKYAYSFSCTIEKVISEKLDIYCSSKPTNIFIRKNTDEYEFNYDAELLNSIKETNARNKLFLVTASTMNYKKFRPVIDFILNDLVIINDENHRYNLDYVIKNNDEKEFKNFSLDFLNNCDFNISDLLIDYKENTSIVKVVHKVKSDKNSYILDIKEESNGTQRMINLLAPLFYTLKEGKVLFIDEIDRSLHPLVIEFIIKKFQDNETNPKNAQLICTSHNVSLLNMDLFRRDDIFFIERNYETSISEIFSLSNFLPRNDENIEKSYLLGRFGAVPFIK